MKKRIFKFFAVVMIAVLVAVASVALLSGCYSRYETLIVYNWGDYIDESVNKMFEKWYKDTYGEKVHIDYQMFDTNESMYTMFTNTPSEYDIMCPSDYMIAKLIREGRVRKVNYDNVPNMDNVDPSIVGLAYDPNTEYSVPYTWGTLGILYDADKVDIADLEKDGFGIFWNPKYAGKVLMKDSVRDAIVAAAMYLYHDELMALPVEERQVQVNNLINFSSSLDLTVNGQKLTPEKEIADIEGALTALKATVHSWEVDQGKDLIIDDNNECTLNLSWSGDATYAIMESNNNLAYYVPAEGSNVWVDGWVISSECQRPELAEAYMNFLLNPEIAVMNMDYIGYTSAVKKEVLLSYENLDDFDISEYMDEAVVYPTAGQLAVCAPMLDFNTREAAINEMWIRAASKR